MNLTDKERAGLSTGCPVAQDLNPLAMRCMVFTDNPDSTARLNWTRPMGIEPTPPELNPGVLSQLNYGVIKKIDGQVT